MAGKPGYWIVALANGAAGLVKTPANRVPVSVGDQQVTASSYLGTGQGDILKNWGKAANDTGAIGLTELGPPGSLGSIFGGVKVDIGTLEQLANQHGAAILSQTPGIENDPTLAVILGGFGGIASGAVRSAELAAAESAPAEAAPAAAGAGAAGAAAKAVSTLAQNAQTLVGAGVAAAIWTWLTTPGHWIRVLEYVGGALLIFLAVRSFAK